MLTEEHFESGKKRNAAITWHTLALELVHFDSKTMISKSKLFEGRLGDSVR